LHDLYFEPKYEEFRPRTIWSLSNAFTSAFKLDPIPQFKATAKLGEFLEARFSRSFQHAGRRQSTAPSQQVIPLRFSPCGRGWPWKEQGHDLLFCE
jgi:hypothetical protein